MIRIITQKRLDRMLKKAFTQGLELRESVPGHDPTLPPVYHPNCRCIIDRDIREIQRKKAVEK